MKLETARRNKFVGARYNHQRASSETTQRDSCKNFDFTIRLKIYFCLLKLQFKIIYLNICGAGVIVSECNITVVGSIIFNIRSGI